MRKTLWLLFIICVGYGGYQQWQRLQVLDVPASVIASTQSPTAIQAADARPQHPQKVQYRVQELAPYAGQFRVLSLKTYHTGREAEFSPLDLAVGWGDMVRPEVYKHIDIQQRNRWYYWRTDAAPIPLSQIAAQSANMHIVPANAEIARQLKQIKEHDLIHLSGVLIEIQASDGWRWRSSLSRTDTGQGACELMRVDAIHW